MLYIFEVILVYICYIKYNFFFHRHVCISSQGLIGHSYCFVCVYILCCLFFIICNLVCFDFGKHQSASRETYLISLDFVVTIFLKQEFKMDHGELHLYKYIFERLYVAWFTFLFSRRSFQVCGRTPMYTGVWWTTCTNMQGNCFWINIWKIMSSVVRNFCFEVGHFKCVVALPRVQVYDRPLVQTWGGAA